MLIRSQNKNVLINLDTTPLMINQYAEILAVIKSETTISLGTYNSYDECVSILDKIQEALVSDLEIAVFEMPEKFIPDLLIADIDEFSLREFNLLKKAKIHTLEQLLNEDYLHSIKGIGVKTLKHIEEVKKQYAERYGK